ncbi:MAG TPA: hypothetical protein VJR92_07840 [Gemmatimonadaceae bacterium]|nr:hypothetical protein [Gemmatimonadaceae bacterium]
MSAHRPFDFPNGKRFAFTVVDDTDVATVANVRPLYELLHSLGMRTTKTVWPVPCPEGSKNFAGSETLAGDEYRAFVLELQRRGFEITWHGATMESSARDRTLAALERFREVFGAYPRIHVNHSHNRENIYWGAGRFDSPLLRWLVGTFIGRPASYFVGHDESSQYWWGDACARHFEYARNLTTSDINTARFNPSMPYRDPQRPLVPWWFSASDAESVDEFNALIHPENVARLEREGGFCIVATHFGKRFVTNGAVNAVTRERLELLAQRPGWFPTVGALLDWLRSRRGDGSAASGALPPSEWRSMQWRWAWDLLVRVARRTLIFTP